MIGYMLTWTTYGSWLQGDERGWRKDGVAMAEKADEKQLAMNCVKSII